MACDQGKRSLSLLRDGKRLIISSLFCLALLLVQSVRAADPPRLLSPADNTEESKSPKLVWEFSGNCPEENSCFRVEVDNSADFSSLDKYVYTNSFSYSPRELSNGVWHWRVKARENSDSWTDWSPVFKFTIGEVSPSPTPQTSISPPTQSQSNPKNTFNISDLPSEINSDQEIEVAGSLLLSDKTNSRFYLKGAFKKADSGNYFGETLADGTWVKNNSSYSNQLRVETDGNGRWEGKIKVKPDVDDSGFDGTGDYVFKIGRYTDTGSGPTWSNEVTLKINEVNKPEPSPSEEIEITEHEDEDTDFYKSATMAAAQSRNYEFKIASVAGEATMSNNITLEEHTRVLEEKKVNWLLILLGGAILAGGIGFTVYKMNYSSAS